MSLKARLEKLEDEFLKSQDYYKAMAIMDKIVAIEEGKEEGDVVALLAELHALSSKRNYYYPNE